MFFGLFKKGWFERLFQRKERVFTNVEFAEEVAPEVQKEEGQLTKDCERPLFNEEVERLLRMFSRSFKDISWEIAFKNFGLIPEDGETAEESTIRRLIIQTCLPYTEDCSITKNFYWYCDASKIFFDCNLTLINGVPTCKIEDRFKNSALSEVNPEVIFPNISDKNQDWVSLDMEDHALCETINLDLVPSILFAGRGDCGLTHIDSNFNGTFVEIFCSACNAPIRVYFGKNRLVDTVLMKIVNETLAEFGDKPIKDIWSVFGVNSPISGKCYVKLNLDGEYSLTVY